MREQPDRDPRRRQGAWSLRGVALLAAAVALTGCADGRSPSEQASDVQSTRTGPAPRAAAPAAVAGGDKTPAEQAKGAAEAPPTIPRKIIYNARVTLVVENIKGLEQRIARLIKEAGGYISQSDQSSYSQSQPTATWTVRVPVDRFDSFVDEVMHLGELQQNHVDSQDVTQEYFDLEARISNKQLEEKRLLKHLADSTGKLEEILVVEKELSRVRGEIEQMQGRIRFLANLSSLSTVTITATEIHDYKPPVRPTFARQIGRTFEGSLDHLVEFGKAIVLFVVAIAPWLPVLVIAALPVVWMLRKSQRPARLERLGGDRPTG
jgi:hypothetical protein